MRREIIINPEEFLLEGLNPYEVMTLISITERSLGGQNLALTKEGGFWPILLTELSLQYDLTENDIDNAVTFAMKMYQRHLDKDKPYKIEDRNWMMRYWTLAFRARDTFPFQLSRPEFFMIQNFIYSISSIPKLPDLEIRKEVSKNNTKQFQAIQSNNCQIGGKRST